MEELIGRIAANVGISEELANQAVGIILNFLNSDGPSEQVGALMNMLPGAADMLQGTESSGGGLLGSIGGMLGGSAGGAIGAMGAVSELTSAGLSMSDVQGVTQEVIGFAKEKAGDELVDQVVGAIPGLNQFV